MRALVLVLLTGCASLLPKQNPYPEGVIISPDVKVAYTFGKGGGLTWGGELSMPFRHGSDLHAIVAMGPTLDLTWAPNVFHMRLALEIVSWFAGIDVGPSLVSDRRGGHFALAISPWLGGIVVVPEYTYLYVIGSRDYDELGTYLKLPICLSAACQVSGGHHHFFGSLDFDDNH